MRILIDLDSVLVQLLPKWLEAYNQAYKDQLTVSDITAWDLHRFAKPECGKDIYSFLREPGWYRDLEPIADGPETVKKLLQDGHDIFLVTSPPYDAPTAVWDKLEWVRHYIPSFDIGKMVFCQHKRIVCGDLIFDDCPKHLEEFLGISVAMSYAYNKGYGDHQVSSWSQFYELISRLEKEKLEKLAIL